MSDYHSDDAPSDNLKDAAELFAVTKGSDQAISNIFNAFERLSHNDVKHWLPKNREVNALLWGHGKKTVHGKAYGNEKPKPVKCKLMYCWARKAAELNRITDEDLKKIVEILPSLDYELPTKSATQRPEATTPQDVTGTGKLLSALETEASIRTKSQDASFARYAGSASILTEEVDVFDVATSDVECSKIDLESDEAIFYEKEFNIEKQLGGFFKRSQDLFKMYAKDSKAMIEDAIRNGTVFEANR